VKGFDMTIKRVWHGWTTKDNADSYQHILQNEVIPGIEAKNIPGLNKFEILRIELDDEVEFVTIISFDSLENVIAFQGEDFQKAYVPDVAQKVLKRWDLEALHYSLVDDISY
jgi:heme-degrading monooxygenase HmoA